MRLSQNRSPMKIGSRSHLHPHSKPLRLETPSIQRALLGMCKLQGLGGKGVIWHIFGPFSFENKGHGFILGLTN